MSDELAAMRAALEANNRIQENLDRKVFHLKSLLETSREISGHIQPQKVMDSFLLMAMGQLGAARGLVVLINADSKEGAVASRGFPASEAALLERQIPTIHEAFFAQQEREGLSSSAPRIITRDGLADHSLFPPHIDVLILWRVDRTYCGMVGLGEKIQGGAFDAEDMDILLNLGNILVGGLRNTLTSTNINRLNAELHRKNEQLEGALDKAQHAQRELDRRVFHLKALNDLAEELGLITQPQPLMESFLLSVQGLFSARQALVLHVDRQARAARTAFRGSDAPWPEDFASADRLLYHCFESSEFRQVAPMSVSPIHEPDEAFEAAGFGFEVRLACFFVIDQTHQGIVALGPRLGEEGYGREAVQLLSLSCGSFMVFLKNALAFETIEALNQDLVRRNEDLSRTIQELTEARHTIDLLERAKERIKAMVQTQGERQGRPRVLDFVLILAVSLLVGLAFNFSNPAGIPLVQPALFAPAPATMTPAQAFARVGQGAAAILDARPREYYDQKRIKGAINVPPGLFEVVYLMRLARLPVDTQLVVYGRSVSRRYDTETVLKLGRKDFEQVSLLEGGLDAWVAAGLPTEGK